MYVGEGSHAVGSCTAWADRSALTKELPMIPMPGDSSRPRANTTSTWGHAADAEGMASRPGNTAGAATRLPAPSTAMTDATTQRRNR